MSPSTRSSPRSARAHALRSLYVACALAVLSAAADAAGTAAPALSDAAALLVPDAKPRGRGSLTLFGLHIYDGYYYAARDGWRPDEPFALQLVYRRHFVGTKIAERSVEEIAKLGYGTAEQRAHWGERMRRIFPDVAAGDRVTGVNLPHRGVHYFHNEKSIGVIDDPEFATAFFAMWLDPRTSEPQLRKELLGERR